MPRKLFATETADLAAAVSQLASAGMPLPQGLRAIAAEHSGSAVTDTLESIAESLASGVSLEDAIAAQRSRLPAHLRGLVVAGAETGRLAEILSRYLHNRRQALELRRKVWYALAYPATLLVVLSALFLFFQTFVVPAMADLYDDFGTKLPWHTRALVSVSGPRAWSFLGILACMALIVLTLRFVLGRAFLHQAIVAAPLVGPMWRFASLAEVSRLLGLLVESRMPLPAALRLTADGVTDVPLGHACRRVQQRVEAGESLAAALWRHRKFPSTLAPLVAWGDESGELSDALRLAGEMYEGRARAQAALVATIVPPLVFLLVVAGVLFLMSAMYSPLANIIESLV